MCELRTSPISRSPLRLIGTLGWPEGSFVKIESELYSDVSRVRFHFKVPIFRDADPVKRNHVPKHTRGGAFLNIARKRASPTHRPATEVQATFQTFPVRPANSETWRLAVLELSPELPGILGAAPWTYCPRGTYRERSFDLSLRQPSIGLGAFVSRTADALAGGRRSGRYCAEVRPTDFSSRRYAAQAPWIIHSCILRFVTKLGNRRQASDAAIYRTRRNANRLGVISKFNFYLKFKFEVDATLAKRVAFVFNDSRWMLTALFPFKKLIVITTLYFGGTLDSMCR